MTQERKLFSALTNKNTEFDMTNTRCHSKYIHIYIYKYIKHICRLKNKKTLFYNYSIKVTIVYKHEHVVLTLVLSLSIQTQGFIMTFIQVTDY